MQTASEVLFVLALMLPPAAVVVSGLATVLSGSSVYLRRHAAVERYRPVRG
jgi:hypothetical protein